MRARLLVVLLALAASVVFVWSPSVARAHGMRSAYLEIVERAPGQGLAIWKQPAAGHDATPRIDGCTLAAALVHDGEGAGERRTLPSYVERFELQCQGPLAGKAVRVDGLGPTVDEAVVRVRLADGRAVSHLLVARASSWTIPAREERATVLSTLTRYVALGAEHIATGWDHLLFVLGVVLASRTRRALALAITAFTLAHSVTLTLTSLSIVRVASAPAEAAIALSLVFLALELPIAPPNDDAARQPRIARALAHPALAAFVFGLVHGLGFAGGLREAGLPEGHVATALVSFNIGVELGQLAFVALVLLASAAARPWLRSSRFPRTAAIYAIGTLGAAALLARGAAVFANG